MTQISFSEIIDVPESKYVKLNENISNYDNCKKCHNYYTHLFYSTLTNTMMFRERCKINNHKEIQSINDIKNDPCKNFKEIEL
jgi:hypothetical protein